MDVLILRKSIRLNAIGLVWAFDKPAAASTIGPVTDSDPIYHICKRAEWEAAERAGLYPGSSQDAADGFIHFSTRAQVVASAAKHRKGQSDLVLLAVDPVRVSQILKWEPGGYGGIPQEPLVRGGQLFPHLYGPLPVTAVVRVDPLPLGPDGAHVFPAGFPGVP